MNRALRLLPLALAALAVGCSSSRPKCPSENTVCDTLCVNTRIDPRHCGGCDLACDRGFVCKESDCACPAGQSICGDRCIDTNTDASHCGDCDTSCATAEVCQAGSCVPCTGDGCICITCGGATCLDLLADEDNCGACGNACPTGTSCLGGTCAVGDLYAACFQAGTVRPFLHADLSPGAPDASGIGGPQSLALLPPSHLLVAGAFDNQLWIVDRATMQGVPVDLGTDAAANQVLVRENRAYVIESQTNTVQVVDLSDPAAPALVTEVSTGAGTNPYGGAFADDGSLWVTLWVPGQVVSIPFAEASPAASAPIAIPTAGLEGLPYPAGVAVAGDTVFVTLNNLGPDFQAAGDGRLARISRATGAAEAALVDLPGCKNPAFPVLVGSELWIPCGGTFDESFASNEDGALIRFNTVTGTVTETIPTGASPARLSVLPDRTAFLSNNAGTELVVVSPEGAASRLVVCSAAAFEFVGDVLVVP